MSNKQNNDTPRILEKLQILDSDSAEVHSFIAKDGEPLLFIRTRKRVKTMIRLKDAARQAGYVAHNHISHFQKSVSSNWFKKEGSAKSKIYHNCAIVKTENGDEEYISEEFLRDAFCKLSKGTDDFKSMIMSEFSSKYRQILKMERANKEISTEAGNTKGDEDLPLFEAAKQNQIEKKKAEEAKVVLPEAENVGSQEDDNFVEIDDKTMSRVKLVKESILPDKNISEVVNCLLNEYLNRCIKQRNDLVIGSLLSKNRVDQSS